jgi:hypothetical protein
VGASVCHGSPNPVSFLLQPVEMNQDATEPTADKQGTQDELVPGDPETLELPPLPRFVSDVLLCALLVIGGAGILIALAMPVLRQGKLIEAAREVCIERSNEATIWLDRAPEAEEALRAEWELAHERGNSLLGLDEEVPVRNLLEEVSARFELTVLDLHFGTVRRGEAFDAVPGSLRVSGDRAQLPLFLKSFYEQERLVRLVALDLETISYGSEDVNVTLRWEYPAPARRRRDIRDPIAKWSPPTLCATSSLSSVAGWNRGKWQRMDRAASELRTLAPRLEKLATVDAERRALERERQSLERWREASHAEARAVMRKLPVLLSGLAVSAVGRVGLRPGPAGTMLLVDDD